MTDEMLGVDDLCISFDDFEALHKVSFSMPKGKLIGLIGPNGCGKSTMMKCISKLHTRWTGEIRIDGKSTADMRPVDIAKIVANVPAEMTQMYGMSVMDMVMLGRYPFVNKVWWESEDDEQVVREALQTFGLDHYRRKQISLLSSGEKQRVLIAKAYVQNPKVMLVDEPTSHLDMRYKLEVMEYLRSMARNDMTVMVAEHDISLMARYCDVCIIMKKGSIVSMGDPKEIITEDLIREVYEVESCVGTDREGEIYVLPKRSVRGSRSHALFHPSAGDIPGADRAVHRSRRCRRHLHSRVPYARWDGALRTAGSCRRIRRSVQDTRAPGSGGGGVPRMGRCDAEDRCGYGLHRLVLIFGEDVHRQILRR